MGYLRLFRRVRIAPGIGINVTRSGPSLSLGVAGAHVTVGRNGIRKTVGVPGTGMYYTAADGRHSGVHSGKPFHAAAGPLSGAQRLINRLFVMLLVFVLFFVAFAIIGSIAFH